MMKKELAVLLALVFAANALHLKETHAPGVDLPAGTVALIADNGQFLSVCSNCGNGAKPDSASLDAALQDWTLEVVGSQVAFKGKNGKYLSRCRNCWLSGAAYPDSAFVHETGQEPYSLWTPTLLPNGKYAFKSDNGNYLARCNGCVRASRPNFAFVHESNPNNPWAQWDVVYTNLPKLGVRTFQADNGGYLKECPEAICGVDNAVSVAKGLDNSARWILERVGTKLAIKGADGNYLSRCNGCWAGGAYPDSAFAHLGDSSAPYSQWAPTKLANGKWVFQADTGKYLARCNNCARSTASNLPFVHVSDPNEPWAQWKLA